MKWIGLTGGIATGKSTVAKRLKSRGIPIIDADEWAHLALDPSMETHARIVQAFGQEILDKQGLINRRLLGKKVFGKAKELIKLESIIHPFVKQEVLRQKQVLQKQGCKIAFYDVPLLFEKKIKYDFDAVVVVVADSETQKCRMRKRDKLSDEEIAKRLASQVSNSEKESRADYVIHNNGTFGELDRAVEELIVKLEASLPSP